MQIILPWPSTKLSPNARLHWAVVAKAKKSYRMECYIEAMRQGVKPICAAGLDVEFVFHPPSRRRIDLDNCIARIKSGIDGLVDVLRVDDSLWRMTFQLSTPRPDGAVEVAILI